MRHLVHLWQRLSKRERLLAGAAGAFLVLVAMRFGVVDPYRAYVQHLEERIAQAANRVRHMQERQESAPQFANDVEGLRQQFRRPSRTVLFQNRRHPWRLPNSRSAYRPWPDTAAWN